MTDHAEFKALCAQVDVDGLGVRSDPRDVEDKPAPDQDTISVSHKTLDTLQDDALELRGVLTVLDSRMRAVSKWETAEDPDSISVPRAAWNAMFDDVQDLRDIRMAMQARLDSAQSRAARGTS